MAITFAVVATDVSAAAGGVCFQELEKQGCFDSSPTGMYSRTVLDGHTAPPAAAIH